MVFLGVEPRSVGVVLAEGLCDLGGITLAEGLRDGEAGRAPFLINSLNVNGIVHMCVFMFFRAAPVITKRIDDSLKPDPVDNVWLSKYYKWPVYSFEDAVQCHRETHHPTVYNRPDERLFVNLELDMRAAKVVIFLISVFIILVFSISFCNKGKGKVA
jgi:hypothetical protein